MRAPRLSLPRASSNVAGSRSTIWLATGVPVRRDVPRSARARPPRKATYWAGSGRSRPSCRLSCATSASEATSPRMARAGSPGMRWISAKTSVATPRSTGIVSRSRACDVPQHAVIVPACRNPRKDRRASGVSRIALVGDMRDSTSGPTSSARGAIVGKRRFETGRCAVVRRAVATCGSSHRSRSSSIRREPEARDDEPPGDAEVEVPPYRGPGRARWTREDGADCGETEGLEYHLTDGGLTGNTLDAHRLLQLAEEPSVVRTR